MKKWLACIVFGTLGYTIALLSSIEILDMNKTIIPIIILVILAYAFAFRTILSMK
jgi:hypothetical protein